MKQDQIEPFIFAELELRTFGCWSAYYTSVLRSSLTHSFSVIGVEKTFGWSKQFLESLITNNVKTKWNLMITERF